MMTTLPEAAVEICNSDVVTSDHASMLAVGGRSRLGLAQSDPPCLDSRCRVTLTRLYDLTCHATIMLLIASKSSILILHPLKRTRYPDRAPWHSSAGWKGRSWVGKLCKVQKRWRRKKGPTCWPKRSFANMKHQECANLHAKDRTSFY